MTELCFVDRTVNRIMVMPRRRSTTPLNRLNTFMHANRRVPAMLAMACGCVVLAVFVRWWPLGLDDQAYVHLRWTTLRFQVEARNYHRLLVAGYPSRAADAALPAITVYPFNAGNGDACGYESYAEHDGILEWSAGRVDFAGFAVGTGANGAGAKFVFTVPLWLIGSVCASPLLLWLIRHRSALRARRRRASNLCEFCGYDLRVTPDRCPECGRAMSAIGHAAQA